MTQSDKIPFLDVRAAYGELRDELDAAARAVPVEPDPQTYNITAAAIEPAIGPSTRAIMPVHLYGQPADMDDIVALGKQAGIPVIEDAAQAQGARYRGRPAGALADAAAF